MKVETKRYKPGAILYLEGNIPTDFYIVKTGKVKIIQKNTLLGNTETIKGSGYIFGIIQSITGISEEERVETVTECEIIVIPVSKIEQLYIDHPNIIFKILCEYSEILRILDEDLIEYDVFYNYVGRNEKIINVANLFIELNQPQKAVRLLKNFCEECKDEAEIVKTVQSMLKGLPEIELLETKELIEVHSFAPGTVIFTELELGTNFFLVKKGKVKITKLKNRKEVILAIFGPGDIFGEMAILNDKPRSATAIAEEVTELMVIDKKAINSLPPNLFVKILLHLTKRIWLVQQQLICLKLPKPTARLYYFLVSKIKQNVRDLNNELDKSYTFKFPLNELYSMVDLSKIEREEKIEDFLNDKNLEFYHDSIKIKKVNQLIDKNTYYYARALMSLKNLHMT